MDKFLLLLAIFTTALVSDYASAVGRQTVLASCFDDDTGNDDNNLYDGGYYYSELSRRLGDLLNGHRLKISYRDRSIIATKGDVGSGGRKRPKIDLHINVVKQFGFTNCDSFGLKNVTIESA